MNTEISVTKNTNGWIFFDADCPACVRSAHFLEPILNQLRFESLPLQTAGTPEKLGVTDAELHTRIHLLTLNGQLFTGADALIEVARHCRWTRAIAAVALLPSVLPLLRQAYDWVAARRSCRNGACNVRRRHHITAWIPLLVLPALTFLLRDRLIGWQLMWTMAAALYAGCKWLTYRTAVANGASFTLRRAAGFLFGWVGMEPTAFTKTTRRVGTPRKTEWWVAAGKITLGASLVWIGVRLLEPANAIVAGWIGMLGIILMLHFGVFELLALAWQRAGVPVKPLMRAPLRAKSLGDLWGARWNTGFHALAHQFVFRPLQHRLGNTLAVLAVFLISGLVHELSITVPARAGYGLPAFYFVVQGLGLVIERSTFGKSAGLANGFRGRAFTLIVAAAPAFWLFPSVFVRNIILPMLHAIGAT